MRLQIALATVILIASFPLVLSQQKKTKNRGPCANAMSQASLNTCFCDRAQKADAELNDIYQQLLKKNASDTNFIEKLKISQRAWVTFRDAQLEAIYPDPDPK